MVRGDCKFILIQLESRSLLRVRVLFGMSAVMLRDAAAHCIVTCSALRSNMVKKSKEHKDMRTYAIACLEKEIPCDLKLREMRK